MQYYGFYFKLKNTFSKTSMLSAGGCKGKEKYCQKILTEVKYAVYLCHTKQKVISFRGVA